MSQFRFGMAKPYGNRKTLLIFLFVFLFLVFTVKSSMCQTSCGFKWSPQVAFKLPAYNTVIAFSNYIYMDSFVWDSVNATQITFNNIRYEGESETCSRFMVSVQNANLTVTRLLHDRKFEGALDGLTGTVAQLAISISIYNSMPSTVSIAGTSIMPKPTKAEFDAYNGDCWYYDNATNTVYIKAILHSPTAICIDWNPPPAPPPAPTPTPTPAPAPAPSPYEVTPTPSGIPSWQILAIIILIAVFPLLILMRRHR